MVTGLARAGARVALNYQNSTEVAEPAFAAFRDEGHEGMLVRADVTDASDVHRMMREIEDTCAARFFASLRDSRCVSSSSLGTSARYKSAASVPADW